MKPVCPYCGSGLDADAGQAGGLPGTTLCPTCGQEVDLPSQSSPTPPLPPVQAVAQPWASISFQGAS